MEMNLERKRKIPKPPSEILLGDLEISTRLYHFLKNLGVKTLEDILKINESELEQKDNFNPKYLEEIKYLKNKK